MSLKSVDELSKRVDELDQAYKLGKATYRDWLDAWHELQKVKNSASHKQPSPNSYSITIPWGGILDDAIVAGSNWSGGFYGEPDTKPEEEKTCERGFHDWKIYDSGFRRFEYCAKCNLEKHD